MPTRARPKIILVDGHRVFRQGLRTLLESGGFCECVGEADSISTLVNDLAHMEADLILFELEMGGTDMTGAIESCQGAHDAMILTYDHLDRKTPEIDELVLEAFLAGSIGHVPNASDPASFAESITLAVNGRCVMEQRLKHGVFARLHASTEETMKRRSASSRGLTDRELAVVRGVAEGLTNAQIAADMGVSERTVKNHLAKIFAKLGVSSRGQAAAVAVKRRLI